MTGDFERDLMVLVVCWMLVGFGLGMIAGMWLARWLFKRAMREVRQGS